MTRTKPKKQAATESNVTAITTESPVSADRSLATISGFKMKKRVILPTLSLQVMVGLVLRIDEPVKESTYVDPDPKKATEKPADICQVTNMIDGTQMLLLVPAVMLSALEREYPDASYVGKIFAVQKLPKRPGKRYFDIDLAEVEIDE